KCERRAEHKWSRRLPKMRWPVGYHARPPSSVRRSARSLIVGVYHEGAQLATRCDTGERGHRGSERSPQARRSTTSSPAQSLVTKPAAKVSRTNQSSAGSPWEPRGIDPAAA